MLRILEEMTRMARAGEPFASATVIETSGSSPRKSGAKMLVRGDGSIVGSVGGGRIEAESAAACAEALRSGQSSVLSFTLTEENGFICGGKVSVFVEPCTPLPRLLVFGAGHVGTAVGALARTCGFHVTLVDRRSEWAARDRLPFADGILCCSEEEAFGFLDVSPDAFILIATTGHELDFAVTRGALQTEARFIGLLGSRRKREKLLSLLAAEGFSAEAATRVVTPVGLDIGAETPEEIAVSIVAELVRIRRGDGKGSGCRPGGGALAKDGPCETAPAGR